jgi:hypothetical protein
MVYLIPRDALIVGVELGFDLVAEILHWRSVKAVLHNSFVVDQIGLLE